MKKQKFQDWQFEQINEEFGLKRYYEGFLMLENWLANDEKVTDFERETLQIYRKKLSIYAETWNEDELKFFFLSQVINLVNFQTEYYNAFTQRKMSAVIGEWEVSGVVDFMVSTGIQNPKQPYFFLHEYKQEKRRDNDPLGQVLIEMLVAQHENKEKFPIYGCYIVGRMHFFVILVENEYAVSSPFDASSADINDIFKLFRFVKHEIERNLGVKTD
jgi:hypothetical protein